MQTSTRTITKKILFWIVTLAAVTTVALVTGRFLRLEAQSSTATDTLQRANQLYESGRFREAAGMYQQMVDNGIDNSTVFYNLGNAHFKQDDVGRAILNYERAARLSPRDADIRANLELARAQAIDKYETGEEAALARLVLVARSWLTLNETAAVTLGLWLMLSALFLLHRHRRDGRLKEGLLYAQILIALLLVGGIFSLGTRLYVEANAPQAIVVAQEVTAVSGPGEQYIAEFTLHSGAEVSLMEQRSGWTRIALPGDQFQGWIPTAAVETVAWDG